MSSRRAFMVEDEGLASLTGMEDGFSGKINALFCTSSRRRPTYRTSASVASSQSQRYARLYDSRFQETPYFLEACSLCKRTLGNNKDIFMYRGDTPFCSEQCREEQINIDEAKERNWNLSVKASSRKTQQKSTTQNRNFPVRTTGTVVAV